MILFYEDGIHLIGNGNELKFKLESEFEILYYKSLKIKLDSNSIRSFKDVTSFLLYDLEFPALLSGHSASNHLMLKKFCDQKVVYYQKINYSYQYVLMQMYMCLPLEFTYYQL